MEHNITSWREIVNAYLTGNPLEVGDIELTTYGAMVHCGTITGFIPRNHLYLEGETKKTIKEKRIKVKVMKIMAYTSNIVLHRYQPSIINDVDTSKLTQQDVVKLYVTRGILKVGNIYRGTVVMQSGVLYLIQIDAHIRGWLDGRLLPIGSILNLYCTLDVTICEINLDTNYIHLALSDSNNAAVQLYARNNLSVNSLVDCVVSDVTNEQILISLPELGIIGECKKNSFGTKFLLPDQCTALLISQINKTTKTVYCAFANSNFTKKAKQLLKRCIGHLFTIPVAIVCQQVVVIILFGTYVQVPSENFANIPTPGDYVTVRLLEFDAKHGYITVEEFIENE